MESITSNVSSHELSLFRLAKNFLDFKTIFGNFKNIFVVEKLSHFVRRPEEI